MTPWQQYVQQMLFGGRTSPLSQAVGPMLVMALQRFLLQNSYEQLKAQHDMQVYQAAINADVQKNVTPSAVGAQTNDNPAAGLQVEPPPTGGWGTLESAMKDPYVVDAGSLGGADSTSPDWGDQASPADMDPNARVQTSGWGEEWDT